MNNWRVHLDRKDWFRSAGLYIISDNLSGTGKVIPGIVNQFSFTEINEGEYYENIKPAISGNWDEIRQFLQAMTNLAWENGIKPSAFESHQSELTATKYHLEDMRYLAKAIRTCP